MFRPSFLGAFLVVALVGSVSGCAAMRLPAAPTKADLRAQTVRGDKPAGPEGACWASDETPAVIETVTQQTAVEASAQGDAGYRTEIRQEIIRPREKIWFRTPCAAALTPDAIATLQRALAARGFYSGVVNSEMDGATRAAIRAFQTPRGLNSGRLSLSAARELGVVAADFGADIPK